MSMSHVYVLEGLGLMDSQCFSMEERFPVLLNLGTGSSGVLKDLSRIPKLSTSSGSVKSYTYAWTRVQKSERNLGG
jgi:hypothetical protein